MIASEHYEWKRSGRHSKRLDALLLATVNMLAKDEPLPHRDFDHPLRGERNDHRDHHIRPCQGRLRTTSPPVAALQKSRIFQSQ
jgi:hypothetical protein